MINENQKNNKADCKDEINKSDKADVVLPGNSKWHKDFSLKLHDDALVHRPQSYGEIFEETV